MPNKRTKNMLRLATSMIAFAAAMGGALALVTMIALGEGSNQPRLERPFATALIVSLALAILAYLVSRTLGPQATKFDGASMSPMENSETSQLISDSGSQTPTSGRSHLIHVHANIRDRIMDKSGGAIAVLSAKNRILEFSLSAATTLGVRPIDAIGEDFVNRFVTEQERPAMAEALQRVLAGTPVRGLDTTMMAQDQTVRTMRWNMDALEDADGEVAAILAMGSDISDLAFLTDRLNQRTKLLDLTLRTTIFANQSSTILDALRHGIDEICAFTNWPVGHVWMLDETDEPTLIPTELWHISDHDEWDQYQTITQSNRLTAEQGVAGAALKSGDVQVGAPTADDPRFDDSNHPCPAQSVALPVISEGRVIAVLEFVTSPDRPPGPSLLKALSQIGVQLGQVFERAERLSRQL